jgi:type II secretory pathway pseudopilin PulG
MIKRYSSRSGITLLEVLIAIGILAIGLSSVVALVPAGRSQASRAVVHDRAATLAANVLADAATAGWLRDGLLTAALTPNTVIVIDPASATQYLPGTAVGTIAGGTMREAGIFSHSSTSPGAAEAARLFLQGSDDVIVADALTQDDPPLHLFVDGSRGFQGRMTALAGIAPNDSNAWQPGRLSVVVFHNRDPSVFAIPATLQSFRLNIAPAALPADRTLRDIVKPGVVIFANNRFHQILSANARPGEAEFFLTLSTGALLASGGAAVPVTLLPDSVGLAERTYTPESGGGLAR